MEFKVGDKVTLTKPCGNFKVGGEYTVRMDNTWGGLCIKDEMWNVCNCEYKWEKISSENKFKVGDKVRLINCSEIDKTYGFYYGYVGTITKITSGNNCFIDHNPRVIWKTQLELVEEEEYDEVQSVIDWQEVLRNGMSRMYTTATINDKVESLIKKKGKIMQAVEFVKRQALKATNPDEFALREAGLHDECGQLTAEGEALRNSFLEKLVLQDMVAVAKEINAERKEKS